jgi:hypothetical protein
MMAASLPKWARSFRELTGPKLTFAVREGTTGGGERVASRNGVEDPSGDRGGVSRVCTPHDVVLMMMSWTRLLPMHRVAGSHCA